MWALAWSLEEPELVHCFPHQAGHEIDGVECWCHPERDTEEPRLVVHNVVN